MRRRRLLPRQAVKADLGGVLRQLSIRDVVLIDRLELEFEPGLGVLTGETGAGKSILLDSLGLALGVRADTGLVRSGQPQASVAAEFELPRDHPAFALLAEQGIEPEPGEPLLVRRTLKADGGSRAFAGAAGVPASLLRDIANGLVEIHGQHDDRGLLNPRGHRALLDLYGRIDGNDVAAAWTEIERLSDELAGARLAAEAAERDRDWLEHAAKEIAMLAPEPGEETSLSEQRAAMQAGAKAGEALTGLDELLGGSAGALAQLRAAARRIERGATDHPLLAEALASLDRALIEASEAEDRIARAAEALAFDPARLEAVEARLFDIRGLARKHRVEPDALADLGEQLQAKLALIEAGGERIAALEEELTEARTRYDQAAGKLREARTQAAARLDQAVAGELHPLKLDAARFRTALAEADPGAAGIDRIEFEVSTNPGAPFGPLTRIASGGELSRFILALKVALAEAGTAQTMIFDEIDRGVGGAVASAIGERLARLAQKSQLLVVTHSPQVAARAAHHYRIEKAHEDGVTRTFVRKLTPDERREEIARMLSGAAITDEARAQAARLLEAA
jgi:DNA repair protein RecN (Recombination protein N)